MHQIIFVGNKTFNVRKSDLNKITENSQFWDIIHIIRGEGVIIDKTNFNKIIFKSRDTICVPHDIEVEFKYKDKISNIFVRFDSLFLPCKSIINLENSHKDLLKDIFIHCKNLYDSNLYKSNKECDLQKKIFDCLTELIVTTINYSYKNMSKYSPIVEKIYNAIVIHYSDPDFKIDEIMKCKKNSYEYLRRLFKKEVGISATQLVKKMKIDNAVKLINMHKGIISVEKLSIESGFIDQEYFSRIFKTYIGIPPLKYIVNVRSV